MTKPVVAIVGRQNVGKSTLLNRVAGKMLAIVEDMPGTTRDRIYANVKWQEVEFTLVDTGGLEPGPDSAISRSVRMQTEAAISEADLIISLVDVKQGITPSDLEIADMLRRVNKPKLLAANKSDNSRLENEAVEFYELGLGEPIPISAYHGRGIAGLLDKIVLMLPSPSPAGPEPEAMKVAIVGRPNVGKSMLLNALVGGSRAVVDDSPGTTRDALDTVFDFNGQSVLLIDTAGIRRRGQVRAGIEQYSVIRAMRAVDRSDVVLLVLDATELVTDQDTHIAGYIQQAFKGIVVVVNKWDLVENKDIAGWNKYIRGHLKFVSYAPIIYTSAKLGQGVDRVMVQVQQVYQERFKKIPAGKINDVIQEAVITHNRPRSGSKQLKVFYATQADVNPPTFALFVNDAHLIHFSYRRYLENKLRQAFGFDGTPLRLIFKIKGKE
ncbi:MAG: ribosome biogenesis GTPase Der [Chloroflexi bacterium RBG_16_50_9]|nr:MAG: ribosome biogenesis GTPase Der [Chloroflexi bacterium RBG_16_50_9]